jgi:hypothetical protein
VYGGAESIHVWIGVLRVVGLREYRPGADRIFIFKLID